MFPEGGDKKLGARSEHRRNRGSLLKKGEISVRMSSLNSTLRVTTRKWVHFYRAKTVFTRKTGSANNGNGQAKWTVTGDRMRANGYAFDRNVPTAWLSGAVFGAWEFVRERDCLP